MSCYRETVLVADVRRDGGTQPRAAMSTETIEDYAEKLRDGAPFPPVDVYRNADGVMWLADGFHRVAAYVLAGLDAIDANVHDGARRDAVLHSLGANAAHGLQRSPQDKRNAVERALADDEWSSWSDREIARRCSVAHSFVAKVRASMSLDSESSVHTRTYTDRHGNVSEMDVSGRRGPAVANRIDTGDDYAQSAPDVECYAMDVAPADAAPVRSRDAEPEPRPPVALDPAAQARAHLNTAAHALDDAARAMVRAVGSGGLDSPGEQTISHHVAQVCAASGDCLGILAQASLARVSADEHAPAPALAVSRKRRRACALSPSLGGEREIENPNQDQRERESSAITRACEPTRTHEGLDASDPATQAAYASIEAKWVSEHNHRRDMHGAGRRITSIPPGSAIGVCLQSSLAAGHTVADIEAKIAELFAGQAAPNARWLIDRLTDPTPARGRGRAPSHAARVNELHASELPGIIERNRTARAEFEAMTPAEQAEELRATAAGERR